MIKEDYVSFEVAKLLKEKGFEQDCDYATSWYAAEYYKNSAQGEWFEGEHQIIEDIDDKITISYLSDKGVFIPAPTLQMATKYLREVHNLHITIEPYITEEGIMYLFEIYKLEAEKITLIKTKTGFEKSELANEAALLYVLKKFDLT